MLCGLRTRRIHGELARNRGGDLTAPTPGRPNRKRTLGSHRNELRVLVAQVDVQRTRGAALFGHRRRRHGQADLANGGERNAGGRDGFDLRGGALKHRVHLVDPLLGRRRNKRSAPAFGGANHDVAVDQVLDGSRELSLGLEANRLRNATLVVEGE